MYPLSCLFFFFFFTSMLPISSLIEFYCLNTAEENHTSKQIARPKLHQEGGKVDARLWRRKSWCQAMKDKLHARDQSLSCVHSLGPQRLLPAGLFCLWNFPASVLEWVAISSLQGSSCPRDWTHISRLSCIDTQIEPSENKESKNKLTLQFGDMMLKLFLVYHSENPRAFKNIATGSLPVVWKRNPKM